MKFEYRYSVLGIGMYKNVRTERFSRYAIQPHWAGLSQDWGPENVWVFNKISRSVLGYHRHRNSAG